MNSSTNRASDNVTVSRRKFLAAGAAAAVAGAISAPAILRATDKAATKPLITGSGEHTFQVIHDWAQLPGHIQFGNTHAVQETADGRIIVHHTGHQSVCFFDPDGRFIESWGDEYVGGAHGLDIRNENGQEFLYLAATTLHKAFKTDLKGNVLLTLDYPKAALDRNAMPCYQKSAQFVPTFTAFGPGGDFYVTDGYGAGFIHRYNASGEYVSTFGGRGEADDQTHCPHGIYCDSRDPARPLLVVADREHHRLQYFTFDGKLDHLVVNDRPQQNKDDTGKLRRPCHFNQRGSEMLIPDLRGQVTLLDKNNDLIVHLGDNPNARQRANHGVLKKDLVPGTFCCPHGATWDRQGNIFVAEWLPYGRVTKLQRV
jgi:uncharacterized protein YfaP (DUF2135 family)